MKQYNHESIVNKDYVYVSGMFSFISDLPTNYDKIFTSYLMNKYIQLLLINDNTDLGNDLDF